MVGAVAALGLPGVCVCGGVLEMQNPRPHPGWTESESLRPGPRNLHCAKVSLCQTAIVN